jgi:phospholipase D-like protein
MGDFTSGSEKDGMRAKLWRGERMCLAGMDVDDTEPDFVGFAIEVRRPGAREFMPLRNRLNFAYDRPAREAVTGFRIYPSTEAPFQKFRWVHFPYEPKGGTYRYRITKKHMPEDGRLVDGTSIELDIQLDPVTYAGFLDVGFTRNFASSQAFNDKYGDDFGDPGEGKKPLIPDSPADGLKFRKPQTDAYQWLGFEARDLIFRFLDEIERDENVELDVFAYDLNEPDILASLERIGGRVRAIIDDSKDHSGVGSAETKAAARLARSAGRGNVLRTHFRRLQHNKVLIARRGGNPFKVLFGSTNFSFRGIYIQANNVLVFQSEEIAALFGQAFDLAFKDSLGFGRNPFAAQWHLVHEDGRPPMRFCFSPHRSADLSLNPVAGAIDQATSSVLFSIAFLNQIRSGPTHDAIERLMRKKLFSYGVSNVAKGLLVRKPDGSEGLVDFAYLARHAPEPFRSEWSGGRGINVHHKFVVTDFSLATAKVFTGSSNLAVGGEEQNGDNLVMIEDREVAAAYAIEAVRVFDHLHFRSRMKDAFSSARRSGRPSPALVLRKPTAISGKPAWFEEYYESGTQRESDRLLFSR